VNLYQSMRVFCMVAELRSFSAAADRLNLAHSAISKHVALLERRLSARLLHRTSRRVGLTEVGQIYLEQAQRILASIDEVEEGVRHAAVKPSGLLRISVPPWLADEKLAALLARYRERYPDVTLEIDVDLVELGRPSDYGDLDVALRVTNVIDRGMHARYLSTLTFRLVATSAFLDRQGRPRSAVDVNSWPLLHYAAYSPDLSVVFRTGEHVSFRPILRSTSTSILLEAVRAGIGPAFMPSAMIERDVAEGRLEYVLPAETASPMKLYAISPIRPYTPAKVTTFLDFLGEAYSAAAVAAADRVLAMKKQPAPRTMQAATTSSE
jgi:DNA-binding transcriptional LysR family regulator